MKLSLIKPIKNLKFFLNKNTGRNNKGLIVVRHHGGGHKKLYRKINLNRISNDSIVLNIEYDPYRSSYITRVYSLLEKKYEYFLCYENIKILNSVKSVINVNRMNCNEGDCMELKEFKIGDFLHNIEEHKNQGGIYIRSAGTYGQLISKTILNDKNFCIIKLPSGEQRYFSLNSKATLGKVSNKIHKNRIILKAGRSRWLNRRPKVRGVAMNAVDHQHGGGRGKTSGGGPTVTLWGWPAKGVPTRNKKKNNKIYISRKNKLNIL